jgi:hypothetical protein
MTMIQPASERNKITGLDDLTEDQLADLDRILMILYGTRPVGCSVIRDIFEDRQRFDEAEEYSDYYFLRASGL